MGWRFRKSINLGGGVKVNLSKSGVGMSAGGKGFRAGIGLKGIHQSIGIPGTGLYSVNYGSNGPRSKPTKAPAESPVSPAPGSEQRPPRPTAGLAMRVGIPLIIFLAIVFSMCLHK